MTGVISFSREVSVWNGVTRREILGFGTGSFLYFGNRTECSRHSGQGWFGDVDVECATGTSEYG